MIFGDYPCCNGPLDLAMPEKAAYTPEACPHCGVKVWHLLSRWEPQSWTEADFLAEHTVDEETRAVTEKPQPPLSEEDRLFWDLVLARMERELLYGSGSGTDPVGSLIEPPLRAPKFPKKTSSVFRDIPKGRPRP